jgi:hypothetical protein
MQGENSQRYLMQFPLPGASTGKPRYILYIQMPANMGRYAFSGDTFEKLPVHAFILQTRGENAGIERMLSGGLEVNAGLGNTRTMTFEFLGEDHSLIRGHCQASKSQWQLEKFELEYPLQRVFRMQAEPGPHQSPGNDEAKVASE